jgi:ATP-dependent Zn protease
MVDFEEAKDKVLMGAERQVDRDHLRQGEEEHRGPRGRPRLVARFVGAEADPVHKVTIIPRGRALGLTQQLPRGSLLSMTREFAQNTICILMGGRVAEEIIYGQKTTGAGNDIERATELARSMVTEWGMLSSHRTELERVSEALLDYETIDGDDIGLLLAGKPLTRPLPVSRKKLDAAKGSDDKRPAVMPPVSAEPEPV